jgi:hypothetical protein
MTAAEKRLREIFTRRTDGTQFNVIGWPKCGF